MSEKKYIVKKENKSVVSKKKVKSIEGFSVKPRNKVKIGEMIDVKEMVLVDNGLIKSLIDKKVKKNFDKLLKMYLILNEDDSASDGDWDLVLDELERFKEHFLSKYKKHLKEKEVKDILKRLELIEKLTKCYVIR